MEIKVGDIAYSRQIHPTSTWGPWESDPFKIIDVTFNQVTGERRSQDTGQRGLEVDQGEAQPPTAGGADPGMQPIHGPGLLHVRPHATRPTGAKPQTQSRTKTTTPKPKTTTPTQTPQPNTTPTTRTPQQEHMPGVRDALQIVRRTEDLLMQREELGTPTRSGHEGEKPRHRRQGREAAGDHRLHTWHGRPQTHGHRAHPRRYQRRCRSQVPPRATTKTETETTNSATASPPPAQRRNTPGRVGATGCPAQETTYWMKNATNIKRRNHTHRQTAPTTPHRQTLPRMPCHWRSRRHRRHRDPAPRRIAQGRGETRCPTSPGATRGGGAARPPEEDQRRRILLRWNP